MWMQTIQFRFLWILSTLSGICTLIFSKFCTVNQLADFYNMLQQCNLLQSTTVSILKGIVWSINYIRWQSVHPQLQDYCCEGEQQQNIFLSLKEISQAYICIRWCIYNSLTDTDCFRWIEYTFCCNFVFICALQSPCAGPPVCFSKLSVNWPPSSFCNAVTMDTSNNQNYPFKCK